ncbi:MAG TPA: hypothetical protein DEP00_05165 [Lachnospiraceae bacterium]|nr:hypothetical protein [Lachnospiraceae bacterium]
MTSASSTCDSEEGEIASDVADAEVEDADDPELSSTTDFVFSADEFSADAADEAEDAEVPEFLEVPQAAREAAIAVIERNRPIFLIILDFI